MYPLKIEGGAHTSSFRTDLRSVSDILDVILAKQSQAWTLNCRLLPNNLRFVECKIIVEMDVFNCKNLTTGIQMLHHGTPSLPLTEHCVSIVSGCSGARVAVPVKYNNRKIYK